MNSSIKSQISQLPSVASDAGDTIAQEANRFGELAKSWWQRNANVVRNAAGSVRDEAAAFGTRTRLYVKDEPVKSVLAAAALGALLTALLMMLFRREH